MGKITEFLKNLFTVGNLSSGLIGLGIGILSFVLLKLVHNTTFQDILIFIGVAVVFILVVFSLGSLLNNTLFKDDE